MKTKIFHEVLKIVSEVTEIPEDVILSKTRDAEVVDARAMLMAALHKKEFYPHTIAEFLHTTDRNVTMVLGSFDERLKRNVMMQINFSYIHSK